MITVAKISVYTVVKKTNYTRLMQGLHTDNAYTTRGFQQPLLIAFCEPNEKIYLFFSLSIVAKLTAPGS